MGHYWYIFFIIGMTCTAYYFGAAYYLKTLGIKMSRLSTEQPDYAIKACSMMRTMYFLLMGFPIAYITGIVSLILLFVSLFC